MKLLGLFILFLCSGLARALPVELRSFALGSCNKQYLEQPLWEQIQKEGPDLFFFAGDNVYANHSDPLKIKAAYEAQNAVPGFAEFRSRIPLIGIWDDHDFTNDNADGSYKHKDQSQKYFLDFMGEPKSSGRRKQKGIYHSYNFVSAGRKVKLILLDTRYFLKVEKEFPILGKEQWSWLERELRDTSARLIVMASGFPIFAPDLPLSIDWADYPTEKERLLNLVNSQVKSPILYLTGDKHFSSIYRGEKEELEFMASGMTHNTKAALRPVVRAKYPNYYFERNFGLVEIAWEGQTPVLTLSVKNARGETGLRSRVAWKTKKWVSL